jgi:hypothetical protein
LNHIGKKERGNNRKRENIDIKKKRSMRTKKKKKTILYQLGLKDEIKKKNFYKRV